MIIVFCFFCFKQKTAYEMRISDWSSDVCSSDLGRVPAGSSIRHHLLDVLLRLSSSAAAGWRFEAARCGRKAQNGGKPSPGRLVGVARPRLCSGRLSQQISEAWRTRPMAGEVDARLAKLGLETIGSASCRERLCQSV